MMISTKLSLQTLALVLVVFTVFTVSLTETIQISDGFTSFSVNLEYKMQPGETQMLTWGIINDNGKKPLHLEMFATGQGAELFVFEEDIIIEPGAIRDIEIFVIVPEDYPTDLELHPQIIAKKIDPVAVKQEGATINMVMQHVTNPKILIGDNPIYYAPEVIEEVIPDIATNDDTPKPQTPKVESIPGETMQEKLDRIKASNLANQLDDASVMGETPAEATGQFEVEDPVPDFDPGPQADPEAMFVEEPVAQEEGGGCLIATATFGSELAPQVQLLREIRDNQLMGTGSGIAFMSGFNSLYYSFSPVIADMERENPAFKELVKLTITPMISTLSVMEYADSDDEVLGLGIGVILMNLGMYVGLPTFGLVKLLKVRK